MSALKPLDEADGGGENYHGGGKNDDEFPSGQCQVCKDVVRSILFYRLLVGSPPLLPNLQFYQKRSGEVLMPSNILF